MNSGDWVENMTALEYTNKNWLLFHYDEKDFPDTHQKENIEPVNVITDNIMVHLSSLTQNT